MEARNHRTVVSLSEGRIQPRIMIVTPSLRTGSGVSRLGLDPDGHASALVLHVLLVSW